MRILCPKCGARYDVPDMAIPAPGREVQCAVCTNAWYQLSGGASEPTDTAVEHAREAHREADGADKGAAQSATEGPAGAPPLPRREIDPAVLRILREEAAFETARRAGKGAAPAGTPADDAARAEPIATDTADPASTAEARGATTDAPPPDLAPRDPRMARLRVAESAAVPLTPAPDPEIAVERPRRDGDAPPALMQGEMAAALIRAKTPSEPPRNLPVRVAPAERMLVIQARRRRGFRLGFAGTAGLACAALLVYLAAPIVAEHLPQGTPFAESIVAHGDRVQAAIVELVRSQAPSAPPQR